ncbi:response regulator [Brumimicrobium oceani]|uniref:Response regulatory domain-containing protein n=1 Tax=Brumimicrobium oceani TaxID=2100725 RepID=A0A2U2XGC4_9FLAO|nr:response regulator [Brumimicrobium oceani]PWH86813.1 hypothetical protein DIT68_00695 [Brumimicrobium oceani]
MTNVEHNTHSDDKYTSKNFNFKLLENRKILIIEDHILNLVLTSKVLELYRIKTFKARNGVEAIKMLENLEVDLILMDIQMPLKNGIETTKELIYEKGLKTPIVALTTHAYKSEIKEYFEAGMVDWVAKPFIENELINTIAKHIK